MLLKDQQYLPASTAPPDDSIWKGFNEATFRQNIASLEKTFRNKPGPKESVPRHDWEKRRAELSSQDYIIPFNTEQQLAEDFAFLVAAEPESRATSAVCIEEQSEPEGLVVRLAADEPVTTRVRKALKDILGLLVDRAKKQGISEGNKEIQALKAICRESNEAFQWWARSISTTQCPDRDKRCCFSKAAIQQIGKIGRYWSLSANLTSAARKYAGLFSNLQYNILTPYQPAMFHPHSQKWPLFCHVHAEVQMVAFYESEENGVRIRPRVIGTSKAACYLCNAFIYSHGSFFLSQTLGQLHGQWTVPDLVQYPPTGRMRIRTALSEVNNRIGRDVMSQSADHLSLDLLDLRERILSGIEPSITSTRSGSSNNITSTGRTSAATRARTLSTAPSSISSLSLPPPAHAFSPPGSVSDGTASTQFLDRKHISDGHDLDEDTILHVMANHIWMNFEMEGSKRGRVAVRPTPPPDGAPIDFTARVEDIADGSQIHIAKRSGSKVVNLELVYGQCRPVFVSLRWC
ncbi:hypothetical protein AN5503.2 [Paecilomyces variotii No. 5]|uniref:Uncharacterized protein n=1 Tax=Byssochlamys spectabilis (strain No. 5 / NBRC 109023) TaxID=1356009 RepID=V5I649_BYSSN|nr:hypothetical protein AN5503.2 [Paecilomyces variotii No. 5]